MLQGEEEIQDTEREGFKIARALIEAARPQATDRVGSYHKDIRYWRGLDHWPAIRGGNKAIADAWKSKGVRNYLYATIDQLASVVLGATPRLRAEPLDSTSTLKQREIAANATRHELERCHWDDVTEDVYLNASIGSIGYALLRMEADKFTGEMKLAIDAIDPTRFYPDPSATRPYKWQYACYEPELDLSQIRDIMEAYGAGHKFDRIKPKKSEPVGTAIPSERRTRDNEEILRAPGTEVSVDSKDNIRCRKANVQYVWLKDDALSTEVKKVVMSGEYGDTDGMICLDCGERSEIGPACPHCGSVNLSDEESVTERKYPFGRLIITCQDVEIYDGPNPDEIDCVIPVAAYIVGRVPTQTEGFGDSALLKSNQMQADKTISQLIDAMRLTLMGYLQIPVGEPAWQNVTNEPGQKVPTRPENANITKWITPQGINPQMYSIADNTIYSDFQRLSGQADMAVTSAPSAPDSATEVKSRDAHQGKRVGKRLRNLNRFRSEVASIAWQMMVQHYVGPRPFMFSPNGSQFESVVYDVSTLPRNLHIRVEADIDGIEKDKLAGQNLVMAMQSGVIPMMPDLLLRSLGISEAIINEVMNRPEMQLHMMQMQAAAAMATQGAMPPGNSPAPPNGAGSPPQRPNNEGVN